MISSDKNKYIDILQVLRGIAAIMVVLHHTVGSIRFYHKIDYDFLNYIGYLGKFGVDFFFVLSGFIIAYSAYNKYNQPKSFSRYIINRFLRIYVPYFPIGIFMFIIYNFLPSFSNGNREISSITTLTLIPHGSPALSVAWTLSFEIFFYILFGISFYSRKLWNWFVLCWFLSIIICNYVLNDSFINLEKPLLKTLFSTYNIDFIMGFITAQFILKNIKINTIFICVVLLLATSCFFYSTSNQIKLFAFDVNILFAIIASLVIFVSIYSVNLNLKKTSFLMIVGNATYSIYLLHNPLQMILVRLFPKINSIPSLITAVMISIILSCAFGYVYYLIFEKRIMISIKSKVVR